jgi:hypothetical protein
MLTGIDLMRGEIKQFHSGKTESEIGPIGVQVCIVRTSRDRSASLHHTALGRLHRAVWLGLRTGPDV